MDFPELPTWMDPEYLQFTILLFVVTAFLQKKSYMLIKQ